MRMITIFAFLIWPLATSLLSAGQYNETLSIGDTAPGWEHLPGTDGREHAFKDFENADAVVVVFTCLSCPTAVDYEERFNTLAKKHGQPNGKVAFVAICVNRIAADRLDKLIERAKVQELVFPYLYDESQKVARNYGAIFTPEYYVLNKERQVTYMGAFDDATDATKVKKHYVEDALIATLKNEESTVKETLARGCRVRYAPDRK